MKIIIRVLVIALTLITTNVIAQNFQGIATYEIKSDFKIPLDSAQVSPEMYKQIKETLRKQFEKTYTLTFNKEISTYKEKKDLDKWGSDSSSGLSLMMVGNGGTNTIYKNTKTNRFINQSNLFGNDFLIKDELQKFDWKLEAKDITKKIGQYIWYKATAVNDVRIVSAQNQNTKIPVTAWYTLEIPINNGPRNYSGLSGLILEIKDGLESIICSNIDINSKDGMAISKPNKGKVVTQQEFNEIALKKTADMGVQGGNNTIQIKMRNN